MTCHPMCMRHFNFLTKKIININQVTRIKCYSSVKFSVSLLNAIHLLCLFVCVFVHGHELSFCVARRWKEKKWAAIDERLTRIARCISWFQIVYNHFKASQTTTRNIGKNKLKRRIGGKRNWVILWWEKTHNLHQLYRHRNVCCEQFNQSRRKITTQKEWIIINGGNNKW